MKQFTGLQIERLNRTFMHDVYYAFLKKIMMLDEFSLSPFSDPPNLLVEICMPKKTKEKKNNLQPCPYM